MIDFDKRRSATPSRVRQIEEARIQDQDLLEFEEIVLQNSDPADAALTQRARRVNDVTAWGIVIGLGIAAIPLASARPIFWMLWSTVIFMALAFYMLAMRISDPTRPLSSLQAWPVLLPALLLPITGILQYGLSASGMTGSFAGHVVPLGTMAADATFLAVIRLLGLAALFILAFEVSTRAQRVNQMAWGIFTIVLLHAIWGLFALVFLDDFVFWGEKIAYQGVTTGTFVNRNSFATFLGMGMVAGVCMILNRAHRPHTRHPRGQTLLSEKNIELAALWLLTMIIAAALLATQSRMGVFASFAAAWLAYLLMGLKHHESATSTFARAAMIAIIGGGVLISAFGVGAIERSLFASQEIDNRTELYLQIADMIRQKPFLGTGLDTFQVAYELVHAPPVSSDVIWTLAHSTYLALWLEAGVILGSMPIIAVLVATITLIGTIRRRRTNYATAVMGLAMILLVGLHSLLDFSLEIQANAMLFTAVMGIALGRLRRRENAP